MGVRLPESGSITLNTTTLLQNTETVVIISPAFNESMDNAQVQIFWYVNVQLAAGTTGVSYRIRRGATIAGTQVTGAATATEVASAQVLRSGCYIDSPGIVAGQQYCLTLASVGAGAVGTIVDACIILMSL